MKKTKFTEQQIAFALRQAETGTRVVEVCRKLGISGCDVLQLEEEVRWPGGVGATAPEATGRGEPAIETHGCGFESGQANVAGCTRKKVLKPVQKRRQLSALQAAYRVSTRRACEVIGLLPGDLLLSIPSSHGQRIATPA